MSMIRAGHDRQTVDLSDPDDRAFWSAQFGVPAGQLEEAICAVGHGAADIRDYVERHFVVPVRWNTAGRRGEE